MGGVKLQLQDSWINEIWPVVAEEATFAYRDVDDDRVEIGGKTYRVLEAARDPGFTNAQLNDLGVERD